MIKEAYEEGVHAALEKVAVSPAWISERIVGGVLSRIGRKNTPREREKMTDLIRKNFSTPITFGPNFTDKKLRKLNRMHGSEHSAWITQQKENLRYLGKEVAQKLRDAGRSTK